MKTPATIDTASRATAYPASDTDVQPAPQVHDAQPPTQAPASLSVLSSRPRSPRAAGGTGTSATAMLATTGPSGTGAAAAPAPASEVPAAALARLQAQLHQDARRPVDTGIAAELINALRPLLSTTHAAATHDDRIDRISERDVMRWYQAQGLSAAEVGTMRRTALLSGLPNPSGSFLNNAMQFIVAPWTNYATGNPWAGASLGFATAAIAAPMNAAQQSAVVSLCESIREHGGHVIVPDKKEVNDKHWLPDLVDALGKDLETFGTRCTEFRDALAQHRHAEGAPVTQELAAKANQLLAAEARLHQAQRDFVMTQGAHDRQWLGNRFQAIARTLRSPTSSTLGLLSKSGAARALSPAAQTIASLVITGMQHVAAGFDERAKQDANNRLNLLNADVFANDGKQKLARGETLTGADIDEGKLRKLIQSPTQALVKRVTNGLVALERELVRNQQDSAVAGQAIDLELGHGDRSPALARLSDDLALLRAGRIDELAPDGLAAQLLAGAQTSVISEQLIRDIAAKYTGREFSSQTAQRIGQMFHLGVLGSAASSVIGKVTTAAQGGTRNVPTAEVLAVAALSGGMAAVGALNQHVAISVKNNRREGETDIGLAKQVTRGVMGGAQEALAQRSGTKTSKAINTTLQDSEVGNLLHTARVVGQAYGPLPANAITLEEAAQQLHPGHASPPLAHEVVVQIDPAPSASAAAAGGPHQPA